MNALIAILIIGLMLLSASLLWALSRLQRRLAEVQARLAADSVVPPAAKGGRARIAIEILNPFELAARETRLATALARLAPRMIERIVYERAATQIAQQMAEMGVRAEVKTHVV